MIQKMKVKPKHFGVNVFSTEFFSTVALYQSRIGWIDFKRVQNPKSFQWLD